MEQNKLQKYFTESCLKLNLFYLHEINSTNDFAKENPVNPPALIITDKQEKGRGRFSNFWFSAEGKNITITLVQELNIEERKICVVNFYTGIVIYNILKKLFPELHISLKWPNDIIINGKKAGGILTELIKRKIPETDDSSVKASLVIIGIGINVNQDEFPEELTNNKYLSKNATSLFIESGRVSELEELIFKITKEFFVYYDAIFCSDRIIYLWKKFSGMIGKDVEFYKDNDSEIIMGKIFDIESDGAIIILLKSGEKIKMYSGEVHLIY